MEVVEEKKIYDNPIHHTRIDCHCNYATQNNHHFSGCVGLAGNCFLRYGADNHGLRSNEVVSDQ